MASFPFVILGALSFGAAKGINFGLTYWLPDYLQNDIEVTDYQKPLIIDMGEIGKSLGGIWLGYVSDRIGSRVLLIPFCFGFATIDLFLMSYVTKD
jgi:MFS family permease